MYQLPPLVCVTTDLGPFCSFCLVPDRALGDLQSASPGHVGVLVSPILLHSLPLRHGSDSCLRCFFIHFIRELPTFYLEHPTSCVQALLLPLDSLSGSLGPRISSWTHRQDAVPRPGSEEHPLPHNSDTQTVSEHS